MSDYNIDDILAEIDRKRDGDDSKGSYTASVTEIIGGNELEQAMYSSGARARRTEQELFEQEQAEQEEHRRRADEIANAAKAAKEKKERRQAEEQQRREQQERDRAAAEELRREKEARRRQQEEERLRIEAERAAEEERLRRLEAEARASADKQSESKDVTAEIASYTAELSTASDAAALFARTEEHDIITPESEYVQPYYKPEVSEDDDDIIFHTRSDLVTTATQQIRKQQRIEEINRALLEADMSAESPDELLSSINPMESRAKAEEEVRSSSSVIGDTLAVAGNDLKRLASNDEEHVKEYAPVTTRRKSAERDSDYGIDSVLNTSKADKSDEDVVEFATAKQRRSNEALVAALNKKLKEQREKSLEAERTVTLTDLSAPANLPPHALNIDYEKQLIDTGMLTKSDPVRAIREADELAARKKRRIASFMLEDIEDEETELDETSDEAYEEEEEVIDLDDENVIIERLKLASKGLTGRLVILALLFVAAIIAGVVFRLDIQDIPLVSKLCSKSNTLNFLYTNLVLGILSFAACSSVITSGLSRLVKLKPDSDTLCAFSHIGALASMIVYLDQPSMLTLNNTHLFLIVSLGSLCFNTVAKLFTVKAAQNNFSFISGDRSKYFIECLNDEGSEKLARGLGTGIPVVGAMRKTELLCDFIISTYCEDVSDRIARVASPVVLVSALVSGLMTYFMSVSEYAMQNVSLACGAATAVLAVGATFSGSLVVMLPMYLASRALNAKNAAVLGYSAVEDVNETSAVLVEAKSLFPINSVKVNNIWDYNRSGSKGTQHIQIDDAIIYAASLAVSSDSVLSDAFFRMINYKSALLKKVSNCVYESNLGVMGWIGSRRVLLGNRDHMKSHGVAVPDAKKEAKVNKFNNEVVYLAVGGEVCMLFFVELSANTQVKQHISNLSKNDVSLVIKTVDGMITEGVIAELFDIPAEGVRVIPYEAHSEFDERTKYSSKGNAAVACDGTFSSFAAAINGSKSLYQKIRIGCAVQVTGLALGILLVVIFAFLGNYGAESVASAYYNPNRFNYFDMYNEFYIALYNLLWMAITAASQMIGKIKT